MSNSRILLSDLYQDQKTYYYIATFDHLSRKHEPNLDKSFVVLLTNVYWISPQNQITPYLDLPKSARKLKKILVADHCWVTLNATWFELPIELFKNDQILFRASIESYSITRDDLKKKRQQIWNQAQIQNQALHADWKARRKQLYGPQRSAAFQAMKAQIRQNNDFARSEQKKVSMKDYALTNLEELKVTKFSDYNVKRIRYSLKQYQLNSRRYLSFLIARSTAYAREN